MFTNVLKLHALTQDWTSHFLSLIMKVRTCHSFTIRTLVDLQLSVISTSELVLVASNRPTLFCLLACQYIGCVHFVCQHIGSVRFVCQHIGLVHFVCQRKGCSSLSSPWEILWGGQMEVRNQNPKASRLQTFATGSPAKISMRSRFARWSKFVFFSIFKRFPLGFTTFSSYWLQFHAASSTKTGV